jgi:hypothetical protein
MQLAVELPQKAQLHVLVPSSATMPARSAPTADID